MAHFKVALNRKWRSLLEAQKLDTHHATFFATLLKTAPLSVKVSIPRDSFHTVFSVSGPWAISISLPAPASWLWVTQSGGRPWTGWAATWAAPSGEGGTYLVDKICPRSPIPKSQNPKTRRLGLSLESHEYPANKVDQVDSAQRWLNTIHWAACPYRPPV